MNYGLADSIRNLAAALLDVANKIGPKGSGFVIKVIKKALSEGYSISVGGSFDVATVLTNIEEIEKLLFKHKCEVIGFNKNGSFIGQFIYDYECNGFSCDNAEVELLLCRAK